MSWLSRSVVVMIRGMQTELDRDLGRQARWSGGIASVAGNF